MFELPSWLRDQPEINALQAAARVWWGEVTNWLTWPLKQKDALTCSAQVLALLAFERDVHRFTGEPEALYRKRVHFAVQNTLDAGSTTGLVRILNRLGVGEVTLEERKPGTDWDIVHIQVTDSQLSSQPALMDRVLQYYGRTCRRYRYEVTIPVNMMVQISEYGHLCEHDRAELLWP